MDFLDTQGEKKGPVGFIGFLIQISSILRNGYVCYV